jgi:hypothetical protein
MTSILPTQFGTRFNISTSAGTSEKDRLPFAQNFGQLLVTNLKNAGIPEAKQVVVNNRVSVLTDTQVGQDVKSDLEASALVNTVKQLAEKTPLNSISGNCTDEFTPRIQEANLSLGKNPFPLPKVGYPETDPQNGMLSRMMTSLQPLFLNTSGQTEKPYHLASVVDDFAKTLRYGQSKGRIVDVEIAPANKK